MSLPSRPPDFALFYRWPTVALPEFDNARVAEGGQDGHDQWPKMKDLLV